MGKAEEQRRLWRERREGKHVEKQPVEEPEPKNEESGSGIGWIVFLAAMAPLPFMMLHLTSIMASGAGTVGETNVTSLAIATQEYVISIVPITIMLVIIGAVLLIWRE